MPAYDASIWDRIAELESRLEAAERELFYTRRRLAERQTAVLVRPAITAETGGEPAYPAEAAGEADLPVVTVDPHELGTPAAWEGRTDMPEITAASRRWLPADTKVDVAFNGDRWWILESGAEIRRGCLAENHPGCGVIFDLKLGTLNPATDEWEYEAVASAKGIDHWYSVAGPYPPAGATGWFRAYPSDTHGTVWHGWDIGCDDDACGTCAEPV